MKGRLFALEVFAKGPVGGNRKVAQCLVSFRNGQLTFTDGLQISSGYEPLRCAILTAILAQLPAGRVSYGWTWSLADVPLDDFKRLPGTSGHAAREITVHSVNLANWECWDSYYRSISNNVRRNVKRAEQSDAPVQVVAGKGLNAIGLIPDLVRMRRETLERVELSHPAWRMVLSYLVNLLLMPRSCCIAIARQDGTPLAGLFGYEFGSDFYYWQGGSVDASNGAAWKLLTDSIGRWYRKHPNGQFIMGYYDDVLPGHRREGLHRQRESLRKSDFPTRIVTFDWTPGKA